MPYDNSLAVVLQALRMRTLVPKEHELPAKAKPVVQYAYAAFELFKILAWTGILGSFAYICIKFAGGF